MAEPGPTVEFEFGAAFTPIRSIPLRVEPSERLTITDLLPTTSGLFWVADAPAGALKVYSQEGRRLRLQRRAVTGIKRPISLASLHGRWVAVLDESRPRISILDETGRRQCHFPLPEVDRAYQMCSLEDRLLAVAGPGWKLGAGKTVHLYEPSGQHLESLFAQPLGMASGRPFIAALGQVLYLADSRTDSFTTYDVRERAVLSFPRSIGRVGPPEGDDRPGNELAGLFATGCGEVLALSEGVGDRFVYDLYALSGTRIAVAFQSAERVVGLEGSLFYSVRAAPGKTSTLRVWKLRYTAGEPSNGAAAPAPPAPPGPPGPPRPEAPIARRPSWKAAPS